MRVGRGGPFSGAVLRGGGFDPAGWLSLVWIPSISRDTTAGFRLAIAAGPLMVSRESIRGVVEVS